MIKERDFGESAFYILVAYITIGIRREIPRLYFLYNCRTVGSPRGPERSPMVSVGTVRLLLSEGERHGIVA